MGKLGGLIPALVTPIAENGDLDRAAVTRILQRCLAAGVTGVSPCGSTGEGWRLSRAGREEMITTVLAVVEDRVPVIAGVPANSVTEARAELSRLGELGVSAALVSPPGNLPITIDDQRRLYADLCAASDLPIVLYNVPGVTGVSIPSELVAELAGHPRIIGIKDSSRDLEYLQSIVWATSPHRAEFSILTGSEPLLINSLNSGADGAIAAAVGVVPQVTSAVRDAVAAGRIDDAWQAQHRLAEVVALCRAFSVPLGWKAALAALGIARPALVSPGGTVDPSAIDQLRTALESFGIPTDGQDPRVRE